MLRGQLERKEEAMAYRTMYFLSAKNLFKVMIPYIVGVEPFSTKNGHWFQFGFT
jgi:hypothetical protein